MGFDTTSIIGADIEALRNNSKYQNLPIKNLIYPKFIEENSSLLFIGINPSSVKTEKPNEPYDLVKVSEQITYFDKIKDIAHFCNNATWIHLDLFYFVDTHQKMIFKILAQEAGESFLLEQLRITYKLMNKVHPKVIVVPNALAGIILGKKVLDLGGEADHQHEHTRYNKIKNIVCRNYNFEFDDALGTYRWNSIPIFFSSMLSGQRALDNGSYERLRWHIKQAL